LVGGVGEKRWKGLRQETDFELIEAVCYLVGFYVEGGCQDIEDVVAMFLDSGYSWLLPYVPSAYERIRDHPELNTEGMTPQEEVADYFAKLPGESRDFI
jgi:hypothetical protein